MPRNRLLVMSAPETPARFRMAHGIERQAVSDSLATPKWQRACGPGRSTAVRRCTRGIWLDPLSRFIELAPGAPHVAGVRCYDARKAIEFDLPVAKNAIAAFRKMCVTWKGER